MWLLAVAVAVPILVALIGGLRDEWYPTGDIAQTELNVRAFPSHPPTIGVAGRFGPFDNQHSHPGPSMAYLLTPVYRLLGSSSSALLISGAVLHIVALSGSVLIARRVGGRSLATAVAVAALLLGRSLGGDWFLAPWNPWMPVTAFFAFMVCVLGVVLRHWWLAPLAVLAGTHAAQTHVSYMVLVHGTMAAALLVVARDALITRRSGSSTAPILRPLLASTVLGAAMWALPLYDQLRGTRNLSWLVRYFATRCYTETTGERICQEPVGTGAALRAMLSELNVGGAWLSGALHDPATHSPSIVGLFIVVVGVAAAVWLTRANRDGDAARSLALVGVLAVLALASTSRIIGDFYDYVIRWTWPLAAFSAAVVVWVLWRGLSTRTAISVPTAAGAALIGLVMVVGVTGTVDATVPSPRESDIVDGLTEGFGDLDERHRHLIRWHDPAGLGGVGVGLLLQMERSGFDAGTDSWTRYAVLPHRVLDEADADRVLYIVVGDVNIDAFARREDATLVVRFDPRTSDEVVESDAARAVIEQRLTELGRVDLLDRIDGQFGLAALIAAGDELPDDVNAAISTYTDLRLPVALFVEATGGEGFVGG